MDTVHGRNKEVDENLPDIVRALILIENALGNLAIQDSETNGAPLPTAISATFTSAAVIVPAGGRTVRVMGMISGVADAVDRVGSIQLLQDGSPIGGTLLVSAGHVTANVGGSIQWLAQGVTAGSHTFSVKITMTAGTVAVGTANAVIIAEVKSS